MLRAALVSLQLVSLNAAWAKIPAIPSSLIKEAHKTYLKQNRVLFYLGKHKQSDKVAIWGQTVLTEDIVRILLESPQDVVQMEQLLRSSGNRWAGNYGNYFLYDFVLSEPSQNDSIFAQVARNSKALTPLDGYVDRIEEVDGVTKFFDKHSKEVFPVGKGKISKCAMAEGDACYLLYRSFLDYENLVQAIKPQEKELIAYFEENKHLLEGDGIVNTEIVEELGFKNVTALGWARSKLKKKLSEDTDHFIHKIVSEQRMVDDKLVIYYLFADAIKPIILITPKEKELIAYLEENKHLLEGDGIVNTEIVEELGFKNGTALGWARSKLKKKLSEDTDHFIHKIVSEQRMVDDKLVIYYLFADAIKPIILITPKEKELIAYLEENKHLLEGDGIVNTEIVEELGFKNGTALGWARSKLKKKLSEDTDHFIHKIVSEQRMVDDKLVIYYLFADAIKPIILITPKEKELIAYLEENMELLEGEGIANTKIVEELGFKNVTALGWARRKLKKKLFEGHFIHRIVPEIRWIDGKQINFYLFADAITLQEKELIAYFEENKHLLEGDGILNTKIVEELGFKNGQALGWAISKLKKKLFEGHFIHRIVPEIRWIDGKQINFYLFADAITLQEKELIAYFEENKHLLEGDGIVIAEMAEELGFKNVTALGWARRKLKKKTV